VLQERGLLPVDLLQTGERFVSYLPLSHVAPVPQSLILTTTPAGGSVPEGCALSAPALCLIGGSTLPDESSSSYSPISGSITTSSEPSPCGGGSISL